MFDRKEKERWLNKGKEQYYKAMESAEKKIPLEKKQFRDMKNKQDIKKKLSQKYKAMDTG